MGGWEERNVEVSMGTERNPGRAMRALVARTWLDSAVAARDAARAQRGGRFDAGGRGGWGASWLVGSIGSPFM